MSDAHADRSSSPTDRRDRVVGDVFDHGEADADAIIETLEARRHPDTDAILDDDARHIRSMKVHQPQALKLPGFGEPLDDCGDYILPAMRFCKQSGKTHEFKRNCLRYDCPDHGPYAIRRRAAGSSSMPGVAPQLKALISRLYAARGRTNHHYHHVFASIPDDYFFKSPNPLEAAKKAVKAIMRELGIQGLLVYHPYRSADETRFSDDRGFWKDLLFHRSDWGRARDDLEFSPHFHIIGVAPHVDVSVTEQVEAETGWVIHRRQDDRGRSIAANPDRGDRDDDDAMARAVTYALSHAGVYDTPDQRRLAAWMIGPDVPSTEVYPSTEAAIAPKVDRVSEDTLGIASPDLTCDCDFHRHVPDGAIHDPGDLEDVESGAVSIDTWPWPDEPDGTTELGDVPVRTRLPRREHVDAAAGLGRSTTDLPPSSSSPAHALDDTSHEPPDVPDYPECGAYLKHISQAGDYLLSRSWRETAPYVDELEETYRNYVHYMTSRDLDPLDELDQLAEETDHDPAIKPPPDPPPDD